MLHRDVSNEMDVLLSYYSSDTCATLYMLESILNTSRTEQKSTSRECRVISR